MMGRLNTLFRGFLLALLLVLFCGVWAAAQSPAPPPAAATNKPPSKLAARVEHLEAHTLTFGLDRLEPLREVEILDEPLWKYLASLIYLLLAYCVAKVIDLIAGVWFKHLAAKTETKLDDVLLELFHGPVKVIALAILVNIGLNLFDWSNTAKIYLFKALIVVVAAALTYVALKGVELALELWRRRLTREPDQKFDDQLLAVLRISLKTFVILVAVLVTAQNLDVNITAALTSLSIGGLAVGLAAQDTLGNLFGAIAIFVDKPFKVGDQIKLDGAEGTVESVNLRSTRVRNPEGQLVAVPNKTMGSATITNISDRPAIKTVMNLGLARSLPTPKVKQALALLEEIYRAHPMTRDVTVSFNQFTAGALNVQILHWWKGGDYSRYLAGMQEMNLAVKERLDAEGISFA